VRQSHRLMKPKHALFLLIPLLLSGCFVLRHGRYDAGELTDGWRRDHHMIFARTIFKYPIPKKPNWNIGVGCTVKGKLDIFLWSTEYDPTPFFYCVKVSNNPIHIILHDCDERELAINADQFVLRYHQTLDVGDSEDLTVILPPFTIGDTSVPQFSARFTWSNRRYLQWIDIGL
jgi:hypothetical protein